MHTPGPWTYCDDHGKRWVETVVGNDDTICQVLRRDRKVSELEDVEFHDNARLLAFAPELYGALRDLLATREREIRDELEGTRYCQQALAELQPYRDLLAAVEGGAA